MFVVSMFFLEGNVYARGSDNEIFHKSIAAKENCFSAFFSSGVNKADRLSGLMNYPEEDRAVLYCI